MTKQGKCDTCRSRKVKCDEKKPQCSACKVKDRPCTYNYGRVKALVREDPNQFSGHGKAKVAPRVYPLISSFSRVSEAFDISSSNPPFHLDTASPPGALLGSFHDFTLADRIQDLGEDHSSSNASSPDSIWTSRNNAGRLRSIPSVPSDPENILRARFIHMPGPQHRRWKPMFSRESWMDAVACRIGYSQALDLAVEYTVNSYEAHRDTTYTKTKLVLQSRSRALKALAKSIDHKQEVPGFDVLLATKLHSFAEVFVARETLSYTTHCLGLAHLLRHGRAIGLDEEHFWSLVDNTYLDEISEALMTQRFSIFDTEYYRNLTDPAKLDAKAILSYENFPEGAAIMHCLIQLPRLVCLVRAVLQSPTDTEAVDTALYLAKALLNAEPHQAMQKLIKNSTTRIPTPCPYSAETNGIVDKQLSFDATQTVMLCTRYWTLKIYLSALVANLVVAFPLESIHIGLPDLMTLEQADTGASIEVAQSLTYCLSLSASLPVLPLRLLGALYGSIGSWHRMARRLRFSLEFVDARSSKAETMSSELRKADTMREWVMKQINNVHDIWGITRSSEDVIITLIDSLAGGKLPEWVLSTKEESELRAINLDDMSSTEMAEKLRKMKMARPWTDLNKAGREGFASMSAGVDVATDDSSSYGWEAGGLQGPDLSSSDGDAGKKSPPEFWKAWKSGGDEMRLRRFDFGFGFGADAFADKQGAARPPGQ